MQETWTKSSWIWVSVIWAELLVAIVYIPVGGFNPFEKYACQIGSFPRGRGENKT